GFGSSAGLLFAPLMKARGALSTRTSGGMARRKGSGSDDEGPHGSEAADVPDVAEIGAAEADDGPSFFSDAEMAPAGKPAESGYVVLARKYRPETFNDLIGQEAMVTTLR